MTRGALATGLLLPIPTVDITGSRPRPACPRADPLTTVTTAPPLQAAQLAGRLRRRTETTTDRKVVMEVAAIWQSSWHPEVTTRTGLSEAEDLHAPILVRWGSMRVAPLVRVVRVWQILRGSTLEMADRYCTLVGSLSWLAFCLDIADI